MDLQALIFFAGVFFFCVGVGYIAIVRNRERKGEDVNQRHSNNRTLLMFAAAKNEIPLLRLLLKQPSIEVNLADDDGATALHMAVYHGKREAVRLLLADPRVDVNQKDLHGCTVLMVAVSENKITLLILLLKQPSIEVNLASSVGFTALHTAAYDGNKEAIKLLLADPRVDVNCKGLDSIPPLTLATRDVGFFDTFQLLLADQRVEVNSVAIFNLVSEGTTLEATPLLAATWSNNFKVVKLLLDNKRVDVNWMNRKGYSALHMAVDQNGPLELFLSHPRVDVNSKRGPLGSTVLHEAVFKNNIEAVRMILAESRFTSHNALIEDRGTSAVGLAAIKGYWDILKELAEHPKVDLAVCDLRPADLKRKCPSAGSRKKIRKVLSEAKKAREGSVEVGTCAIETLEDNTKTLDNTTKGPEKDAKTICWFCHADVSNMKNCICAGCKKARYCSFECQGLDWARHGDYCVAVQEKIKKKKEAKKSQKESL